MENAQTENSGDTQKIWKHCKENGGKVGTGDTVVMPTLTANAKLTGLAPEKEG